MNCWIHLEWLHIKMENLPLWRSPRSLPTSSFSLVQLPNVLAPNSQQKPGIVKIQQIQLNVLSQGVGQNRCKININESIWHLNLNCFLKALYVCWLYCCFLLFIVWFQIREYLRQRLTDMCIPVTICVLMVPGTNRAISSVPHALGYIVSPGRQVPWDVGKLTGRILWAIIQSVEEFSLLL